MGQTVLTGPAETLTCVCLYIPTLYQTSVLRTQTNAPIWARDVPRSAVTLLEMSLGSVLTCVAEYDNESNAMHLSCTYSWTRLYRYTAWLGWHLYYHV